MASWEGGSDTSSNHGCRIQLKLMLFNKKILALIACGSIGATAIAPMNAQAISVASYVPSSFGVGSKWEKNFDNKIPTYNATLASTYHGKASWYGPGFYGRPTASGRSYNPNRMTAAHKYLPFGTLVRVTNLNNGRSRVVEINDRGPYIGGRIIDLSERAASELGVTSTGVAPVTIEVLN